MITKKVISEVKNCTICAEYLPLPPRPIFQISSTAKILVAGQAPGIRAHNSCTPFNDPSGDRLRDWMGVDKNTFYNAEQIAILPMGFCYPGTGERGDLPPRKECAKKWRQYLLNLMPNIELKLLIGQYAINWHLQNKKQKNLTETVRMWQNYWPNNLPLPHPSPRNNIWLKKNPWFESDVLPKLRNTIARLLYSHSL